MYSLKRNLSRNLLLTLILAMPILLLGLYQGIELLTRDFVASRLQHDTESLIAALYLDDSGQWAVQSDKLPSIYHRVGSGHYFGVRTDQGLLRSRSLFDQHIKVPALKPGQSELHYQDAGAYGHWLSLSLAISKQGQTLTLWVAEDIRPQEESRSRFLLLATGGILALIAALLAIQYRQLQLGFAPLAAMPTAIRQLRTQGLALDKDKIPSEIAPLVDEITRLIHQLGQRVERSRHALGNLAHEMKRPLQGLRSWLDSLPESQRAEGLKQLATLQRLLERELKRSAIVGPATPGRFMHVGDDLPPLLTLMGRIHAGISIDSHYDPELVLALDRDDLLELLGNLLDNGCKHARSKVTLNLAAREDGVEILIEDDGSGISAAEFDRITTRGVRLDEQSDGHGLGLAICKDIADSYFGELDFSASALGGLRARAFLPWPI